MATSIAAAVSLPTTTHHRRRQRVTPSANMNDNRFRARRTSQPLSTASRRSGAVSTDAPSAATATTTQGGGVSSRWRGPSADEAAGASPPPPGGAAPARDEEEAEVAPAHRGGLEVPNWHYRDLIDQGRVFRETFPVRYDEAGPDKRATMHTVASMVAECACNHAQALWGLGQSMPAGMLAANLGWVCTRMHIVVDAYPAWGDQVEVNTWFEAQGKIAARRDFAITSVGNGGSVETPVGVATSQWVAFNIEKRKMARIPAAVLHEFKGQALADSPVMGADYAAAVAKLPDVRGVPGCDVDTSGHVTTVRRSDVDMNGHVNNVVYAEVGRCTLNQVDP
jgi:fatty acyl-ACP thioesterase A